MNMAYCCLVVYGKLIQKVVFGELRVSEQQVHFSILVEFVLKNISGCHNFIAIMILLTVNKSTYDMVLLITLHFSAFEG